MTETLKNAKDYGRVYYARHMEAGLCGYGDEVVLVKTDSMKNMMPTFAGKPVYINHDDREESERLETLRETADGYVVDCFYNELDGWLWSKVIVIDDKAKSLIDEGWRVSNAYVPTQWGPGGDYHNCPYDRSIESGLFTHLALVPNPRYENAAIMNPDEYKAYCAQKQEQLKELQNSKSTQKGLQMFKLFKTVTKEVSQIDGETFIEFQNAKGQMVKKKISEMVNAVEEEVKKEKETEEKENTLNSEVEVDGEMIPVGELISRYNSLKKDGEKMNEEKIELEIEEEDLEKGEKEEEEKTEKEVSERTNSKGHFNELRNAHLKTPTPLNVDLSVDQVQRGKSRYGSAK